MEYPNTQVSLTDYGKDLNSLSEFIGEELNLLKKWTNSIPQNFNYVVFEIPKKIGKRKIEAPNDDLKALQSKIYKKLLKREVIPTAATGFVFKRSIIDNALPHIKSQIIIKLDLKNFFYSIKAVRIYRYWLHAGWNEEASLVLTNICCKDGYLPQGSPTSPALSNLVNRIFDGRVLELAENYGAKYSRYADDITISFPNKLKKAELRIKSLISSLIKLIKDEGYKIQYQKGIKILRSHQRQIVTGLIVNEEVRIPRETRKLIRAMQYRLQRGLLSEKDKKRLEGYELFSSMVEKVRLSKIQTRKRENNENKVTIINNGGEIRVIMANGDIVGGDKITAGDNIGGIQNIGKFQNVISNLNESGNKEFADAILQLTEAIVNSKNLSPQDKENHSEALKQIGEEVIKEKPNKTIIKYMWEGLSATLKAIPDIAKAVGTVAPLIAPFLM